jgi:hypothetical protein
VRFAALWASTFADASLTELLTCSVGSAVATAVWTSQMPQALARYVPTDNTTLLAELYGSIYVIAAYPAADPVRTGAIEAYGHVMKVRTASHVFFSSRVGPAANEPATSCV